MKLSCMLTKFAYKCLKGNVDTEVNHLVYDSRKVEPGDVFVCISGTARDAHDFVTDVAQKGAAAIIVEKDVTKQLAECDVTVVQTENTRLALACMSADYFGNPAEKLTTIGITGTKGKTTTTYMVRSVLEKTGVKTGLIGTIETIIGEEHIPASNTTPESYIVQETFAKMVEAGIQCVVMEVSSQGLMLHRVSGFTFDYGIFTNLSEDHIGPTEHKDFEDYMRCKAMLFKQCKTGIVNADDPHVDGILDGATCKVERFGMEKEADLKASDLELFKKPGILGIRFHMSGKADMEVEVDIPGRFSVYNSLTAIAICLHFTDDLKLIQDVLKTVQVKGRVEIVPVSDKFTLMIDYAHNAVSLESLLLALKEYHPKRLVCVFGCGGNRSAERRFQMGEVAGRLADLVVVTTDNPRDEDPEKIADEICKGLDATKGKYGRIPDRGDAIAYGISHAKPGDIVVIAGKGHEKYQEICGQKFLMDDRQLAMKCKVW